MSTTIESTALDDQERARREGSVLWGKTKVLLDERDSLKVEVQRLQAMVPNPDKARSDRTQDIEDLVLAALDNADLLARVVAAIRCHKIGLVIRHLRKHMDRYKITKPPCHKTVKAILQKHGYL